MKNEITRLEGKLEGELQSEGDTWSDILGAVIKSGKSELWAREKLRDFECSVLRVNKIRRKLKKLGGVYQ
jgi:hypothetical protein